MSWSIIVHGGAGATKDSLAGQHRAGCKNAVDAGVAVLRGGGNAVDAACAAARVLEDDPSFNASIGGALDTRGLVTVDAAIMRGSDLAYGAIGCVTGCVRAVELARKVMDDGKHCLLVGRGAVMFARQRGIPLVDPDRMATSARKRALAEKLADPSKGTIGVVARDTSGLIAAATSTGGLTAKHPGRVGDSPIAGAGTYARNDLGGASATGHGETMMRTVFTYQLLLSLRGVPGDRAAAVIRRELDEASARVGGDGGAIAILPSGEIAFARNTPHMGVAWAYADGREGTDF